MRNYFLYTFLLLISCSLSANAQQGPAIDSLNRLLDSNIKDSLRGYVLDELSYEWFYQNLDSSLLYGQKAYEVFKNINLQRGLAQSSVSIAAAYHYKNHWDSAEFYYKKSLDIRTAQGDSLGQAKSLNNLGVLYMDNGKFKEATEAFIESLKFREALNDYRGLAMGQNNLAIIFRKQGNYQKAIEYYSKALKYFESKEVTNALGSTYINLSALYNYQKDYADGLIFAKKAMKTATRLESNRLYGEACVNISDSFLGLDKIDSSLLYTENAIEIFTTISDTVNLASTLNSFSSLQIRKGDFAAALEYSLKLNELNKTLKNKELEHKNALNLSEVYAGLGNMEKAYEALTVAYESRDLLLNESLNESINELTAQFEHEKSQRKITELELDQKTAALTIASSKNQRNTLILASIIIVVIAIFLFLLLRSKSRTNRIISVSLEEKETLLKEIHHRVKNNLQVISSLLNLQMGSLDNKEAKEAVKEGQNRVKSIALIHQKLYQNTDLKGIDVNDYLIQLVRELLNAFGADENVEYKINTNGIKLDIDTVIPVGLIINELITNTLKYAFEEGEKGQINVALSEKKGQLELVVSDNGKGMDEGAIESNNSFGWKMIKSLCRKLKAEVTVINNHGSEVRLNIERYKLAI